ncbi:MAG: acetyl-CoA carboxylase biotin carboxyl carrier protein subunit [Streptococcaceae bacterium]|jgi:biotin carboxyl carrier protein|nr:acetyl-CoA carboxylase biotin carboxyl carrier protein subunit [Streptococcaceae bacterium]
MLRKFKIRIDGKEYLVEMEEEGVAQAPLAPQAAVVSESAPTPAPTIPTEIVTVAGEGALLAPMPGAILKVLVNVGDTVEENQPVMILEAMKMENQIVADKTGSVSGIHVTVGNQVNPGDALITIV